MTKSSVGALMIATVGGLLAASPGTAAAQDIGGGVAFNAGMIHSTAVRQSTFPAFPYAEIAPHFWVGPLVLGLEGGLAHDVLGRSETFAGGYGGVRVETRKLVLQAAAEGGEHSFMGIGSDFGDSVSAGGDASVPYVGGRLSIAGHTPRLGLSMGVSAFVRWDQGQTQTGSTTMCTFLCLDNNTFTYRYMVGGTTFGLAFNVELGGRLRRVAPPTEQPAEQPAKI
jgi:hypothetical protein